MGKLRASGSWSRRGPAWTVVAAALVGAVGMSGCAVPTAEPALPSVQPHVVVNAVDESGAGSLSVDGCTLLDSTSVFTQRIDSLPPKEFSPSLDPIAHVAGMLSAVGMDRLRPGSSSKLFRNGVAGMPLNTVQGSTRMLQVGTPDTGIDTLSVLMPSNDALVNWQDQPNTFEGDRHLMVLDRTSCRLQEHISYNHTLKTSAAAVEWSTPVVGPSTGLRINPKTGQPLSVRVDGADLPITPLVYRFDEVFPQGVDGPVGEIHHAIRIALPKNVNAIASFVNPAAHADGVSPHPAALPMGTRLRLRSDALERMAATLSPGARAVIEALNEYGAVVADSTQPTTANPPGGAVLGGEFNPAWPVNVLTDLSNLNIADFEVVDVGCWFDGNRFVAKSPLPASC